MTPNPFEYVDQILYKKNNLIVDSISEKEYNPFLVNKSLSYHSDCILYANEMNRRHFLDKKLQNDFLLYSIRSRKRPFVKWTKSNKIENLEIIKTYFNCSSIKALEIITLLDEEKIEYIRSKVDVGGILNTK